MSKKEAFTLIELLIVVAIIAILAAVAIPNFLEAQTRGKIAKAKSEMRNLGVAIEVYQVDHNEYPEHYDTVALYGYLKRLQRLTTPIAYLSDVPEDPFSLAFPGLWVGYNYPYLTSPDRPHPWTYDYANLENLARDFGGPAYYEPMLSSTNANPNVIKWGLLSLGPDNDWQSSFTPSIPLTPYDASNGTVSRGDIIYLGPSYGFVDR